MQEQRTREVGRERTADLNYVTLIISLFLLLGEKLKKVPVYIWTAVKNTGFPNKSRPELSMAEWTTNTQEGNEQSGRMGPVFCSFTFDMTLHKLIDVLDTRVSVGQLTSNQIYGLMNLMAFISKFILTSFPPHSGNNPPPRKGRMREKATVVIQIVVCPLISSLLGGFDKAQPSPQCYYTKKIQLYSIINKLSTREEQTGVRAHSHGVHYCTCEVRWSTGKVRTPLEGNERVSDRAAEDFSITAQAELCVFSTIPGPDWSG